jgi:hypothetical protein
MKDLDIITEVLQFIGDSESSFLRICLFPPSFVSSNGYTCSPHESQIFKWGYVALDPLRAAKSL